MPMNQKPLLIHIDVDSPLKLIDFYRLTSINYDTNRLEDFYRTAFERANDFFASQSVFATFFVVGDELEKSVAIQKLVLKAFGDGHEIENHTYSHPFGLTRLTDQEIRQQIEKCGRIIREVTGTSPIGFRSPGYNLDTRIINVLQELGYHYDSSGFWSIMNPLLSITRKFLFKSGLPNADFGVVNSTLPVRVYRPHVNNWLRSHVTRDFLELPLPRTRFALPFYNNFNLWAPGLYSNLASNTIDRPYLVYLFHIIEFMDSTDPTVPKELIVHPNLKKTASHKIKRSREIIRALSKNYRVQKTRDYIRECQKSA